MEGLKLDHFKKIHEDEKHAVLQHPKGHKITVAKTALSEKLKDQLKAIPMYNAGQVPESQDEQPILPDWERAPSSEPNATSASTGIPVNTADEIQKAVPLDVPSPSKLSPVQEAYNKALVNLRPDTSYSLIDPNSGPPDKLFPEALRQAQLGLKNAEESSKSKIASANKKLNQESMNREALGLPHNQLVSNDSASVPQDGADVGHIDLTSGSPGGSQNNFSLNPYLSAITAQANQYKKGLGQEIAGTQALATETGLQGQETADILHQQELQQQKYQEDYSSHYNNLTNEIQNVKKDIQDGHINPNQYLESMSTGSKIATALGMLVSGFSGATTNAAQQFLNNQIERNIDAQKANLGKKNNLLSALYHEQGNLATATNTLRAFYKDQYADQLKEIANKHAGPMAKAAAQQQIGKLLQDSSAHLGQSAQALAIMSGQNGKTMQSADPGQMLDLFKRIKRIDEDQYKTGIKELEKKKEAESLRAAMQNSFNDLNNQFLAGNLSPADRRSAINTFAGRIAKIGEGRFNMDESKLQADAILPGIEGNSTRAKKQQRFDEFFETLTQTPTLTLLGLTVPKTAKIKNVNAGAGYQQVGNKR